MLPLRSYTLLKLAKNKKSLNFQMLLVPQFLEKKLLYKTYLKVYLLFLDFGYLLAFEKRKKRLFLNFGTPYLKIFYLPINSELFSNTIEPL